MEILALFFQSAFNIVVIIAVIVLVFCIFRAFIQVAIALLALLAMLFLGNFLFGNGNYSSSIEEIRGNIIERVKGSEI